MKTYVTIAAVVLLSACAAPINQRTASNYYQAGESAMNQGNLPHAREMFSRALINARLAHMGPEAEGQLLEKLGHVYGNMCQYNAAEQAFVEAIDNYEKAYGQNSLKIFPIRVEVAQFSYDVGLYEKAVMYFDKALPMGAEKFEAVDPAGFAAVMRDYANALARVGNASKAKEALTAASSAENKAGTIKVSKATAKYVRYPAKCERLAPL